MGTDTGPQLRTTGARRRRIPSYDVYNTAQEGAVSFAHPTKDPLITIRSFTIVMRSPSPGNGSPKSLVWGIIVISFTRSPIHYTISSGGQTVLLLPLGEFNYSLSGFTDIGVLTEGLGSWN